MLGTFGLNFPIVLTAMAKSTFHGNAGTYGLFNIALAIGSASGALVAGAAARPKRRVLVLAAAGFGLAQAAAAIAPDMAVFLALLVAMGFLNLAFQSMANASVQLAVDPELRGRVMGLYMLAFIGGTPIGAPVIGVITNHFGARPAWPSVVLSRRWRLCLWSRPWRGGPRTDQADVRRTKTVCAAPAR